MKKPLSVDDIKPRPWVTGGRGGLSFIHAHTSRLIRTTGQSTIYMAGPGHGGPALVATSWLEGTYTEAFPRSPRMKTGCSSCSGSFSAPVGFPATRQ